jgi:hypothetical protein
MDALYMYLPCLLLQLSPCCFGDLSVKFNHWEDFCVDNKYMYLFEEACTKAYPKVCKFDAVTEWQEVRV